MAFKSDIEIAQEAEKLSIRIIAERLGIEEKYFDRYGKDKGKVDCGFLKAHENDPDGKLILVTAISPTPAGEGKTTTSVGLADSIASLGKKSMVALREPSLGPVFGIKGGAAGGGYAQVIPMEDINLHFTGDMHAIGAANNLIAAIIDNHIQQDNELRIDTRRITWTRVVDMNDRQLRHIVDGMGGLASGRPREDGFEITVASEIMAILCLSRDIVDLKEKVAKIIVGYNYDGEPITAGDLKVQGAVAALLKDALKPNLVQTLEHTPAFVHGGPFANIAHGCNSLVATKMALKLADYVVTEAGFAADLGAEKFVNIKCRKGDLHPAACVLVATVRALKYHGGVARKDLEKEDPEALRKGMPNLLRHLSNIKDVYGLPVVVAINAFPSDTEAELALVKEMVEEQGANVVLSEVWAKGSEGGRALAEEVVRLADMSGSKGADGFKFTYDLEKPIKDKIKDIAKTVYHARSVHFDLAASKAIEQIEEMGYGDLPVCMAKTQFSFSDEPSLLGAPEGFDITVTEVKVNAGAGFIVARTGTIMTMPGLPKRPSAEQIDVDSDGTITGLF